MALAAGLVLVAAGVLAGVLQVHWAGRDGAPPTRVHDLSTTLSPRARSLSSVGIAGLLFLGSLLVCLGQPWWAKYLVLGAAGLVTAAAQALALRRNRLHPGTPAP